MNKLLVLLFGALSVVLYSNMIDQTIPVVKWERPEIKFPKNNPLTEASVELGGALFFEILLSRDTSISCQSCHLKDDAFADHLQVGEGIKGRHVTRNTPTLFNVGFHPYFMIDGKFKTLEEQVLGPINEHREFDMNPELVVARLKSVYNYDELSIKAYGEELTIDIVQKALANFQRVLISDNSRFDQFKKNEIELTDQEMLGWDLFRSPKLNCIKCHNGYNFTTYDFENNGLYEVYQDSGRLLVTKDIVDIAKFKIPSLRNIAITFPYMHDGSVESLEAVIDHYASGGKMHESKSSLINGFEINKIERTALITFLKTLTEERLLDQE